MRITSVALAVLLVPPVTTCLPPRSVTKNTASPSVIFHLPVSTTATTAVAERAISAALKAARTAGLTVPVQGVVPAGSTNRAAVTSSLLSRFSITYVAPRYAASHCWPATRGATVAGVAASATAYPSAVKTGSSVPPTAIVPVFNSATAAVTLASVVKTRLPPDT